MNGKSLRVGHHFMILAGLQGRSPCIELNRSSSGEGPPRPSARSNWRIESRSVIPFPPCAQGFPARGLVKESQETPARAPPLRLHRRSQRIGGIPKGRRDTDKGTSR